MGVTLSYLLVTSFACCTCFSYCQFISWHEWSHEALWQLRVGGLTKKTDFWKVNTANWMPPWVTDQWR